MRIVFAGAGFTALEAAPLVKKALPDSTVTLISRHKHKQLDYPSAILNHQADTLDIEQHCKQHAVECIIATITMIDREHRTVHMGEAQLSYDYLVLDLGSEPSNIPPGAIPCTNRHNMLELKHHVIGQIIKAKEDSAAMYKTFVVAGTSIQAIETATELKVFVEQLAEKHLFFANEFTFILVTQREQLNKKLRKLLEQQGIEVYDEIIKTYTPGNLLVEDRIIETQTLVWSERKPDLLLDTLGLVMDGACDANEHLQTNDSRVFAVGGCANRTRNLAVTALHRKDAQVLGYNLIATYHGKAMQKFKPGTAYTVSTANKTAFLWTSFFTMHGKLAYSVREHYLQKHRQRIQKA